MTRPRSLGLGLDLGLALVALLGVGGCEKDPPAAAAPADPPAADQPSEPSGPKVVVEDPGASPAPGDPPPRTEPTIGRTEIVATTIPCKTDEDCVKASCCHATTCVAAADGPDCSSTMCTMDCRGGTMDCNGGCLCQDGTCAAQLWWAPEG